MFLLVTFILLFNQTSNKLEIKDAWMRPAAKEMNSALYFKIVNNSDKPDTLYKISSDVAELAQIHETYKKENDMMGMREAKNIIVKPHSIFEFKPMGYHIMLINVNRDLKIGDKTEADLFFKNAGEIKINISVSNKK